jgi:2-desacetyl-2-hydroxyethyl bacteriochlorophyllide A dehydrogenase
MKAVYYEEYGSPEVLKYGEQDRPQVKEDQVLVRVHATSVNPVDWKIRNGDMKAVSGLKFPKIPGKDIAGEVVEKGANVTRFKPGDKVFAMSDNPLGGAYAEYALVSEKVAVLMPAGLDYGQAAAVPLTALTALQALRDKGQLEKGEKVLINGASGGVGSFAIQIAKALGAGEVIGVCSSEHVELVKSLGADRVIDYHAHDFTQDKEGYDLIFDAVGKSSFANSKASLRENGRYVTTVPDPKDTITGYITSVFSDKQMKILKTEDKREDLALIRDWIEAGKLKPIIDRVYPLQEAKEAHRYSEQGEAAGKIVLEVIEKTIGNQSAPWPSPPGPAK